MKKYRSKNGISFSLIYFFVVFLAVGYAYLNTNLAINGNTDIANNRWNVYFNNIVKNSGSVDATSDAVITNDTRIDFEVDLDTPGDVYSFTVDVVNDGTFNAILGELLKVGLTSEQEKYIDYDITYFDNEVIMANDALPAGYTESIKVTVKYKDDLANDDLPTENQSIALSLDASYIQSDGLGNNRRPMKYLYNILVNENKENGVRVLDSEASTYVTADTGINFNAAPGNTNGKGVYIRSGTEDDTYPVYYYRGAVTTNNVIFGGYCWKMVRTTETGGIKLIYNGVPKSGKCNNEGTSSQIGTSAFNEGYDYNAYVGYMYGTPNSNNYDAEHLSTKTSNSSTIKQEIDAWYSQNMTGYTSYLEDTIWCNDRSFGTVSWSNGDGYGKDVTVYGAQTRTYSATATGPTLECINKNDRFTVEETVEGRIDGNGALTYPVALLTADELTFAGQGWNSYDQTVYLHTGSTYWTMSPYRFANDHAYIFRANSSIYSGDAEEAIGVRPSISLEHLTRVAYNGDGTEENPYVVLEPGVNRPTFVASPSKGWASSKTVTISYPAGYDGLYSIDGGNTWLKYTKPIKFTENTVLMAKASDGINESPVASYTISQIETTKPTLTVSTIQNSDILSTVTITVNDEGGSGLSANNKYQYCTSTSSETPIDCTWTDYTSGEEFTLSGEGEKVYIFVYPIMDNAGNINDSKTSGVPYLVATIVFPKYLIDEIIAQNQENGVRVLDNEASTYVSASTGIDFNVAPSDTNGKGVYIRSGTESDTNPVYYYRGAVENNNVLFGGYCWKMVRTTETGGIKLIYNGTQREVFESTPIELAEYINVTNDTSYAYTYNDETKQWTSTNKTNSKTGTITFSVATAGYYAINYVVSSEEEYDKALFYLDNEKIGEYSGEASGSISLGEIDSTNIIKVEYTKDRSGASGSDIVSFSVGIKTGEVTKSCGNTGTASQIGTSAFNSRYEYSAYVGYMFGTINASTYEEEHLSTKESTSSTIKRYIDTWYSQNMTSYTSYLEDTIWCNDRSFASSNTGTGTGASETYYGAYGRLTSSTPTPSLECVNKNDRFTVEEIMEGRVNGNGALTYPVALLTADELTIAGQGYNGYSTTNYLHTGQSWWSLSPYFSNFGGAVGFRVYSSGHLVGDYNLVDNAFGVRPSVSLRPGTQITEDGDGSYMNPFVVQ